MILLSSFVETNESNQEMCFNNNMKQDHIETLFNDMLDDIRYIKLATYFKGINR